VQHVARMGKTMNIFTLGWEKKLKGTPRGSYLMVKESELVGWIHLAQNRDQWLFLVSAAVNIRVLQ
jgi:hypothetical protein